MLESLRLLHKRSLLLPAAAVDFEYMLYFSGYDKICDENLYMVVILLPLHGLNIYSIAQVKLLCFIEDSEIAYHWEGLVRQVQQKGLIKRSDC